MKKTNLKIIAFAVSIVLILSVFSIGSTYATGVDSVIDYGSMITEGSLYDAVYKHLIQYPNFHGEPRFSLFEAYEHYEYMESDPDWVVVEVHSTGTATKCFYEIDGYYIYCYRPSYGEQILSYYVVNNEGKEILPLTDAIYVSKDKYYSFFTNSGYDKIIRIGDINDDKTLNIKDATLIQKCLADLDDFDTYDDEIVGFSEKHNGKWERYISDFDRDGERNIKDATAIQKHIAGLEY